MDTMKISPIIPQDKDLSIGEQQTESLLLSVTQYQGMRFQLEQCPHQQEIGTTKIFCLSLLIIQDQRPVRSFSVIGFSQILQLPLGLQELYILVLHGEVEQEDLIKIFITHQQLHMGVLQRDAPSLLPNLLKRLFQNPFSRLSCTGKKREP